MYVCKYALTALTMAWARAWDVVCGLESVDPQATGASKQVHGGGGDATLPRKTETGGSKVKATGRGAGRLRAASATNANGCCSTSRAMRLTTAARKTCVTAWLKQIGSCSGVMADGPTGKPPVGGGG